MLLNTWSWKSSSNCMPTAHILVFQPMNRRKIISEGKKTKTASFSTTFTCLGAGIDGITEIVHNKVLVAAVVSAAVGQLLKPSTSAIFYGKKFDFKAAFQAGGFPSTHSSAAVATAASLGLERGFSDSIFGLAVVYAGLTMYDAQGVRREVGTHAKVFNSVLSNTRFNSIPSNNGDDNSLVDSPPSGKPSPLLKSNKGNRQSNQMLIQPSSSAVAADVRGGSKTVTHNSLPLKESIGHTEIEVLAGALLGLCVSLAVCNSTL